MTKIFSDAGCIKVGNDFFTVLLSHGMGDGTFTIEICEEEEFESRFVGVVEGEINIYESDVTNNVVLTLSGKFGITSKNGKIYFIGGKNDQFKSKNK